MFDIEDFTFLAPEKLISGVNKIPDKSGIYTWYLDFSKFKHIDSKEEFKQRIQLIDSLISRDILRGNAKSFFRRYDICLTEKRVFLDRFVVDDGDEKENKKTVGDKLEKLTLTQCKEILSNIAKFSMLVSPLYIGIAKSLRERYKQHKRAFFDIKKMQHDGEDENRIFIEAEKKFGGRAAIRGFNWEYLIFAYVEMDIDTKSRQEQEYLLNRFYNPILGRR